MNETLPSTPSGASAHVPVEDHAHQHDRWCGHVFVVHHDHLDFLHDGRVHRPCVDHVDELPDCDEPVRDHHLSHSAHMHVHQPGCGHDAVTHLDHLDYLHGQHRHAIHLTHYDEH